MGIHFVHKFKCILHNWRTSKQRPSMWKLSFVEGDIVVFRKKKNEEEFPKVMKCTTRKKLEITRVSLKRPFLSEASHIIKTVEQ